jgi:hypothetical protein
MLVGRYSVLKNVPVCRRCRSEMRFFAISYHSCADRSGTGSSVINFLKLTTNGRDGEWRRNRDDFWNSFRIFGTSSLALLAVALCESREDSKEMFNSSHTLNEIQMKPSNCLLGEKNEAIFEAVRSGDETGLAK